MPVTACRLLLLASLSSLWLAATGCAGEVVWLGEPESTLPIRAEPLDMTVAVTSRSFEATRIAEQGVLDRLALAMRESQLFQGVMYPVPPGVDPMWELQVLAHDSATESNSNLWRSALVSFFVPIAYFVNLESEYTLDLQVILVRYSQVVGTYTAKGHIRYVYQAYANRPELERQGVETVVSRSTRMLLAAVAADAARIESEDRRLQGTR